MGWWDDRVEAFFLHGTVTGTMSRLVVHLNGADLYDVEPGNATFETPGDFEVVFQNHGQPVHVHLRPDDDLAQVTAVEGTNHYVPGGSALAVEVPVADRAIGTTGQLEFVTGYGKGNGSVGVAIRDPDEDRVAVDEDLASTGIDAASDADGARPTTAEGDGEPSTAARVASRVGDRLAEASVPGSPAVPEPLGRAARSRATVALVALAVLALALAGVAAATAPSVAVVIGIFVVLVGLGVAGYLLVQ